MKNFLILLLYGLMSGVIGGYFFISLNSKYFADTSQAVIPVPTIPSISEQNLWEKAISESASSLVGFQVFQGNKLVKEGSGIIVSSDGLIITVADLAIAGAVYQIFYEDKIFRGSVLAVDYVSDLVLVKTSNQFSNVADFSREEYQNGQDVAIVGKLMDLSKPVLFSQKGTVSYITSRNIIIDAVSNIHNLFGAGVIDRNGDFLGVTFARNGRANLIQANLIQDFFKKYITR